MRLLPHAAAAFTSFSIACASSSAPPREDTTGVAQRCGAAVAYEEGDYLETSDGARLWYHVAGPEDAPAVLFLHGGPGYNTYAFERAVGALLERDLRMIYLDQRGCGRSSAATRYGMDATIDDVDALLRHLAIERVSLLGHSFGALVAIEYLRHRPQHVDRMILVDMSADVPSVLGNQVAHVASAVEGPFAEHAEAIEAIVHGEDDVFTKLMRLYGVVGRDALQREVHWASADAQTRGEAWDAESGLLACTRPEAVQALLAEGYMVEAKPTLRAPLERPGALLAGRRSHVVGAANVEAAAREWGLAVRWFEESGHFVYVEEPEAFAAAVVEAAR
ncbi:MAG: alpha/beta hydrolase [Myxococcales bacterium]|nr:alpha/beta hydrolase [Myxococcales bacterium]